MSRDDTFEGTYEEVEEPEVLIEEDEDVLPGGLRPPPWPEPVDGAFLIEQFIGLVRAFLCCTKEQAMVIGGWILVAYAHDAFRFSPILNFNSPTKGCGKTTALEILLNLCPVPLTASNITYAMIYRVIEIFRPTLLIDEGDTFLSNSSQLRGIINSGHNRKTAYVIRSGGGRNPNPRLYSTWSPKAFANIGQLPDTLRDRSFGIRLQRSTPLDNVQKIPVDAMEQWAPLRMMAARWAADNFEALKIVVPDLPATIQNPRARDNWGVLLSVYQLIGEPWLTMAKEAAEVIAKEDPPSEPIEEYVLRHIRDMFEDTIEDYLPSRFIVDYLNHQDDAPWIEDRTLGGNFSPRKLASILGRFGIRPVQKRQRDGANIRCYARQSFFEAWARYVVRFRVTEHVPKAKPGPVDEVAEEPKAITG